MTKRDRIQERLNDLYARYEKAKADLLADKGCVHKRVIFAERSAAMLATLDVIYIIDPERGYSALECARRVYESSEVK